EIGERDGVTETKGAEDQCLDQQQRDAPAKTGGFISQRRESPFGGVGRRFSNQQQRGGNCNADKTDGCAGQRFRDEGGNDSGEQCEVMPRCRGQAGRRRYQKKYESQGQRPYPFSELFGSGGRSANWRDWFRWRNGWRGHGFAFKTLRLV